MIIILSTEYFFKDSWVLHLTVFFILSVHPRDRKDIMKIKFLYFDTKQCIEYYHELKNSHLINRLFFNAEFKRVSILNEIVNNRKIKIESVLLYKVNKKQYEFKIISKNFRPYIRNLKPIIINPNIKCECSFSLNCISIDLLNGLVYMPLNVDVNIFHIKNVEQIRIELVQ